MIDKSTEHTEFIDYVQIEKSGASIAINSDLEESPRRSPGEKRQIGGKPAVTPHTYNGNPEAEGSGMIG